MAAKKAETADKPKRPLSAYFLYAGDKRATVKAKFPTIGNTEIVKKLGEMWRELPANEKKVYEDKAAAAKAEYNAKYGTVKETKPKKPLSAYMLFSNHVRPDVKKANPTVSFGEVAKLIGAQWRGLPESEKKKWKDLEDKEKAKFAQNQ
ncbi:hypothetical protein GUITHDRAFT_153133 [Guillardia theta CCMP2712]|uniref:HMG box domain-containing protein n=1 Tax=Guillardia theta (strain CCMP2712) TaxID=905079 RepID=L1J6Q9_GUITC|nr:hypothetical protein GUITHDRAFT_153133 [Guillardia theta CCMP2712]EKX44022.1 hypothetical protein GUITHDRAFT_153133 [Guillardia theta CCMP2712]|eukprot:XP_005831002.1 hypothetical protein GUITHDRAFT_153133 [Guillardia theta CCMP2712]